MDGSAGPRRGPKPSERTLPVEDLPLPPPGEVTIAPTAEPPRLPPDKEIHPRRRLPHVPKGPNVPDPTPSPPLRIDER